MSEMFNYLIENEAEAFMVKVSYLVGLEFLIQLQQVVHVTDQNKNKSKWKKEVKKVVTEC